MLCDKPAVSLIVLRM